MLLTTLFRAVPLLAAVFIDPRMTSSTPHHAQPSVARPTVAPRDSMLLTPSQLREGMARGGVVLLHIGERADYKAGHIPGAQFLPYEMISTPHEDRPMLELPTPEKLDSLFESLGVSHNSRVVLYWSKGWYSPTTRVFLTLDYLGLGERTSILDGGLDAWRASGGPVTTEVAPPVRGSLKVNARPDVIVDAQTVRAAIGDSRAVIIDARDARFFSGESTGMHAREGHVPGATNLPFTSLLDDRGAFKSRAALERLLTDAGATPGKRVIAYCHIGQQATVVYFAARLLGREARLYDGSWEEWSRRSDLPVAAGQTARPTRH